MPTHKKIAKSVSKALKREIKGTKLVGKAIAKTAKTLSFGAFKSRGGKLLPRVKVTNVRRPKKMMKTRLSPAMSKMIKKSKKSTRRRPGLQ